MYRAIMDNKILLSLCIPTYNRSETLINMLDRVIHDPDFDEEVEIVISDNCSTDDTEVQIRKLASEFTNIRYFRNSENVKDKNFYLALERGRGRYLKLLNDYVFFKNGGLKIMKDYIRKYDNQDVNLFFYSNLRYPYRKSKEVEIENVDAFIRIINNKITWITNFGIWKERFKELRYDNELWKTQLAQMEWTLNEASLRKSIVVNYRHYETISVPDKKMSYVFFVPHVVNYYEIYKSYVERGLISEKTIEYDKYRALSHYVGSRIIQYVYLEKEASFDLITARKILDEYFGNIAYYRYLKIKGRFLGVLQRSGLLPMLKSLRKKVFK